MTLIPAEALGSITDPEVIVEQIIQPESDGRRYPYFHRLRELAPLHLTEHPALKGFTLVSSYDLVSTVLRTVGNHSSVMDYMHAGNKGDYYQMAKNWMFHRDTMEDHDRIRNVFAPYFTPKAIERHAAMVETLIHELLDRTSQSGGMDLMREFAYPLPSTVIARVLGLDEADVVGLQQATDRYVETSDQCREMDDAGESFRDQFTRDLQGLFRRTLEARRQQPRDDLISALSRERALSDSELVDNFVFALIAGHTTTTDMIGNMVVALWRHPGQRAKLLADPARIPAAIHELMRYDSSIGIGERCATEPVQLNGRTLPAGTKFTVVFHAANHDPACFPEPDTLDLDRNFSRQPVPFGGGRYFCLGSHLARLELELSLKVLLMRFPKLEVTALEWPGTLLTHGPKKLQVTW